MTGRRGRRSKQLLDVLKKNRGYCELKAEELDGNVWRTGFGRGCGPVVRQTAERKVVPCLLRCFLTYAVCHLDYVRSSDMLVTE